MYEVAAQEVRDLFAAHLDGAALPLVCVVSGSALGNEAQTALASSARSLGYGDACTFVTLDGPDGRLDASSLLLLMEGLDPLCVIAADGDAAHLLADAWRCPVPEGAPHGSVSFVRRHAGGLAGQAESVGIAEKASAARGVERGFESLYRAETKNGNGRCPLPLLFLERVTGLEPANISLGS